MCTKATAAQLRADLDDKSARLGVLETDAGDHGRQQAAVAQEHAQAMKSLETTHAAAVVAMKEQAMVELQSAKDAAEKDKAATVRVQADKITELESQLGQTRQEPDVCVDRTYRLEI